MAAVWDNCNHEWSEVLDSQFSNEYEVSVECIKCKCPGAKDIKTGSVFWPAT